MTQRQSYVTRRKINDDGNALIGVVMFGLLASMTILSLVGRIVVEGREVANSLAQTRAYWAAMGINNYVLSRTAQAGWCTAPCNGSTIASNVQNYGAELSDLWNWTYLDVSTNYAFTLVPTTTAPATGSIGIRTTFTWTGSAPVMTRMTTTRPLEIRFSASQGSGWGAAKGGKGALMSITSMTRPSS